MPLAVWLTAFLLGAIPFGYVVARAVAGVDIRTVGDGNPGGRNVYLHVGRAAGIAVMLLDSAKGAAAILIARVSGLQEWEEFAAGMLVVLGHDLSPFLKFHGGQGLAATIGVLLVLLPRETLIGLTVLGAAYRVSAHWDESIALGMVSLLVLEFFAGEPQTLIIYTIALLPLVGIKKLLDRPRVRALRARGKNSISH